jgi:hypothetical protein
VNLVLIDEVDNQRNYGEQQHGYAHKEATRRLATIDFERVHMTLLMFE